MQTQGRVYDGRASIAGLSRACIPQVCIIGVHLMGVHLMGVHLMGVPFIGVHSMGVSLRGVHLIGMHLMGVPLICRGRPISIVANTGIAVESTKRTCEMRWLKELIEPRSTHCLSYLGSI
jgi:hypothetical protein